MFLTPKFSPRFLVFFAPFTTFCGSVARGKRARIHGARKQVARVLLESGP